MGDEEPIVLVTTPHLDRTGGVGHYYATLRPYLSANTQYMVYGVPCPTESNNATKGFQLLVDCWRFLREVIRSRCSVVHLNPSLYYRSCVRDGVFLLIAKILRRRVIVFFRGWDDQLQARIERYLLPVFRNTLLRADAVIVLAQDFKRFLERVGYVRPIIVETTTVDDRAFTVGRRQSESAHFNILYLARLEREKGIYETIDAYRIIKTTNQCATLTIAGDGSERKSVREYVNALHDSDINLLGFVTGLEKERAFLAADVYCLVSWTEGLPNSVLEAMAYGLPIVTRPVGGIKDFFEQGRMGFLSEGRDPAVFAEYFALLLHNPELRRQIGAYNRHFAGERFAASKVAARLKTIYSVVNCSNHAPPRRAAIQPGLRADRDYESPQ
jgi:glycosyltransferase involved in cell wall biosynthesis